MWAPVGEPLVSTVAWWGGCQVIERALGKKMKIIFL
ncbi:hypothetical protein DM39_144 [Burkholderia cenocepacia]|uniref:Uncharacterized protein n=1 Tax=Burkholderia cenocepacia TaxID=95486 RepID=A0AAN0RU48_9BURK|nr:hypothetical protein DM39_144 [Burkholderia cenocepacia]